MVTVFFYVFLLPSTGLPRGQSHSSLFFLYLPTGPWDPVLTALLFPLLLLFLTALLFFAYCVEYEWKLGLFPVSY